MSVVLVRPSLLHTARAAAAAFALCAGCAPAAAAEEPATSAAPPDAATTEQPTLETPAADLPPSAPFAELRALDKVTARVTTLYAAVGTTVRFGTLEITPAVCFKRPPEEPPESAAFLTIVEHRPGTPASGVFSGWMFASSPGLSAMEHPVYDVWVLDCPSTAPSDAASSSSGGSP